MKEHCLRNNLLITFVVPVFNVEAYISRCIESILAQTEDDWELILVDNGSTDQSGAICDKYSKMDNRICVLHQENLGPASARNIGLEKAKGKWIAYVDSDDWIEENYVQEIKNVEDDCYDLIFFSYVIETVRASKNMLKSTEKQCEIGEKDFEFLEQSSINTGLRKHYTPVDKYRGQVWTKVYRKKFMLENELRSSEKLMRCQDVMLNLEVYGKAKRGLFIPKTLYHYRYLTNSLCHKRDKKQVNYLNAFAKEMGNYLKKTEKYERYNEDYSIRLALIIANCCFLDFCNFPKWSVCNYQNGKRDFLDMRNAVPYQSAIDKMKNPIIGGSKRVVFYAVQKKQFFLLFLMSCVNKWIKRG